MFISYRYIAFAAGLIFLGVSALAQESVKPILKGQPVATQQQKEGPAAGKQKPAHQNQKPKDFMTTIIGVEPSTHAPVTEKGNVKADRQYQHQVEDLKAQNDMARWAKYMFGATLASVIVTALGLLLIWKTLEQTAIAAGHTEDMLVEAKETTKAALGQVKIAENTAEAQLRPYLEIGPIRITRASDNIVVGEVVIKNVGQTPAADIKIVCKYKYGGMLSVGESESVGIRSCINPSQEFPIKINFSDPDGSLFKYLSTNMQNRTIQILSVLTYQDPFTAGPGRYERSYRLSHEGTFHKGRFVPLTDLKENTDQEIEADKAS